MPGEADPALGNEQLDTLLYFNANVTFPTLGANTSSTNTLTVPGVLVGDSISCSMNAPPAHLFLDNAYVSSANTLTITWSTDGTGITGAATLSVFVNVLRPNRPYLFLPQALV
jgi:hypothetical protein